MREIKTPENAQLLIFPMIECTVAGGFKNSLYKKDYGYVHYGVDFDDRWGKDFDVIASGDGKVLGIEKNSNSIGGVVVIQYDNVQLPGTRQIIPLIARYYHLYNVKVVKGQTVKAYDVIGTVSGGHKWYNHVHMELDTDIKYPFYTPQVSEDASKLLVRNGATDTTLLNPMNVLVVGEKQTCVVHSLAVYADKVKDAPQFSQYVAPEPVPAPVVEVEKPKQNVVTSGKIILNGPKTETTKQEDKKEESPKQEAPKPTPQPEPKPEIVKPKKQCLILPIKDAKLTCGYKNAAYYRSYGFAHYGADFVSCSNRRELYGLGHGTVYKVGWDGIGVSVNSANSGCGYVLIVIYDNVLIRNKGTYQNVVCTYMHMKDMPLVKVGTEVTTSTLLGYYGGTGAYVDGDHLHIQFDLDDKHPEYCMAVAKSGHKILKHGTVDTTVDPCDILFIGKNQTITPGKYENQYDKAKVLAIPKL